MKEYILNQLEKLMAIDSPSGFTHMAKDYAMKTLVEMGYNPIETKKGTVFCNIGGEGKNLILSAHLDTLGGMVSKINSTGSLEITRIGGLMAENIETENCRVYTRFDKVIGGTFQLKNASVHVNGNYKEDKRTFENMEVLLDEVVTSKEDTLKLGIDVGDYVCFDPRLMVTSGGYIKSRFLDDKLSVAILLGVAKYVVDNNVKLNANVNLFFSVFEEVGHGASSLPIEIDEMLCVDMGCVGEGLNCTERQVSICVKDSAGPSNYEMTTKLVKLAKEYKVDYALDVYPHYGSDADASLSSGNEFKHCLIGAGVYASHGYERSHVDGVKNTFDLILKYIEK